MWFIYIFFFILGTLVGSFLNVVVIRLKKNESILKTRSHCPYCKKKLKWFELIPIISFFIQKGRCRKCKKKISWQYPLVEFFTGLIFILSVFYYLNYFSLYNLINFFYLLVFSCFLLVIFVYDLKYSLVSDKVVYPAVIITILYDIYLAVATGRFSILTSSFAASLVLGGFFLFLVLISKEKWMGMGDVKIGFLLGLFFGPLQLFAAVFLAFLFGALISLVLIIFKKKTLKSEIPFGPFLTGASFIIIFWGSYLIDWYFNIFLHSL
ncbi:MAG: hypothetical protein A2V69_03755 [Candidatus Portnoybacteria bacterium RBG_13_40_8]|uniref:Prepilin peptidase n=1 Tax=Candidatus Portnoybacteria bacterium RBG_13_40_8 TaxID=1801990 RepID=A0A1G2F1N5_9BACT|nr:MAG: hypothetical protein A2V69_03755 [Candidatus Portnoybacteria bacterium RBG_13_40_8]OGZ35545.1 MAG: hypothetical protein A2V60_02485 [Candidatus Portnoybacteria bacterium RIFCSPHIGHO2_01_FULL_39_19]